MLDSSVRTGLYCDSCPRCHRHRLFYRRRLLCPHHIECRPSPMILVLAARPASVIYRPTLPPAADDCCTCRLAPASFFRRRLLCLPFLICCRGPSPSTTDCCAYRLLSPSFIANTCCDIMKENDGDCLLLLVSTTCTLPEA